MRGRLDLIQGRMHACKRGARRSEGAILTQGTGPEGSQRLTKHNKGVGNRGQASNQLGPGVACPGMWGPATHVSSHENRQLDLTQGLSPL